MTDESPAPSSVPALVLAAIRRRWWLLLLFALVGGSVGYLLYATRQPTYRSEAKLRVLKRDAARDATAGRAGYVDDYVNSQQETIMSEYILGPAGASPKMKQASPNFQQRLSGDKMAAYDTLRGALVVTRGKDASVGLANSVLQLSYTSDDPRDARIALEAVIDTFTRDLKSKSDDTVKEAIRKVENEIADLDALLFNPNEADPKKQGLQAEKTAVTSQRFNVTSEEPTALATRAAASRDELSALKRQLAEVDATLKLLKEAKGDRRDRVRLVELVTGSRATLGDTSANSLEGQKRLLDLNIQRLSESLGKDHPTMKEEVAKRDYVAAELKRLNPDNPNGETDDLALLQAQLTRKGDGLKLQQEEVQGRLEKQESDLKNLRPLLDELARLEMSITRVNELKANKSAELTRLQSALRSSQEVGGIEATVLNEPRDGGRVGPVLLTWLAPGLLLGSLAASGVAALLELRDQRFRSAAEVRQRLGLPIVGHLPALRDRPPEADAPAGFDKTLVTAVRPKSAEAEAFRGLRTQVLKSAAASGSKVIQITSPCPGDGKSTVGANLAISLAQAGHSVVLLDADFRKPRVHTLFGMSPDQPGLAAAADGSADVFAVIRTTGVENFNVIPCGPKPDAPAELLSSPRFNEVLKALRGRFDYVIVDTPPLLPVSDPRVVAQRVDAVVLTLRLTKTSRTDGTRAAEFLTDLGVNVLGVAVNSTRPDEGYGYGYGGYGGYGGYRDPYGSDGYTG